MKISSKILFEHSNSIFLNENIHININFIRYLCECLEKKSHIQIQYFFNIGFQEEYFNEKKSIKLFKRVELKLWGFFIFNYDLK